MEGINKELVVKILETPFYKRNVGEVEIKNRLDRIWGRLVTETKLEKRRFQVKKEELSAESFVAAKVEKLVRDHKAKLEWLEKDYYENYDLICCCEDNGFV